MESTPYKTRRRQNALAPADSLHSLHGRTSSGPRVGERPLPPLPGGSQLQSQDRVEGVIFQYKETTNDRPKAGAESPMLEGNNQFEGTAIFQVSPTGRIPSKSEVEKLRKKIAEGKGGEVKLPTGPQRKRLGQFHQVSAGKMRLDLDDKDSLRGIMILTRQEKIDEVWIGSFSGRDANKWTGCTWQVEVRSIND